MHHLQNRVLPVAPEVCREYQPHLYLVAPRAAKSHLLGGSQLQSCKQQIIKTFDTLGENRRTDVATKVRGVNPHGIIDVVGRRHQDLISRRPGEIKTLRPATLPNQFRRDAGESAPPDVATSTLLGRKVDRIARSRPALRTTHVSIPARIERMPATQAVDDRQLAEHGVIRCLGGSDECDSCTIWTVARHRKMPLGVVQYWPDFPVRNVDFKKRLTIVYPLFGRRIVHKYDPLSIRADIEHLGAQVDTR